MPLKMRKLSTLSSAFGLAVALFLSLTFLVPHPFMPRHPVGTSLTAASNTASTITQTQDRSRLAAWVVVFRCSSASLRVSKTQNGSGTGPSVLRGGELAFVASTRSEERRVGK